MYFTAFRNYLRNHAHFEDKDGDGESLKREIAIESYLVEVVKKLERKVHMKNRIDLYNKEGVGLNFAI
jgi:hypothetical protein